MVLRTGRALLSLLLIGFLLTLAGCGGGSGPQAQSQPQGQPQAQPRPLTPVTLVLDWYPNAVHTFLLTALENGYFRDEGIDLTLRMPAENPTDGIKLVGAGKETFALYYQPDVLVAREQGIPIVSVAAVVRHPLNHPMTPVDSGIASPKDLAGKVVGYPSIPMNIAMIQTMVRTDGGDPQRVTMRDIGWDLIPAIATKNVNAISGGYINHEKILLEKQGIAIRTFDPVQYGVPDYHELLLITGADTLQQDRALVEAFWRAAQKGFAAVKADPEAALDLLEKHQAKEVPIERDVEAESLRMLLPLMDDGGQVAFGRQEPEAWAAVGRWMQSVDLLQEPPQPEQAYVQLVP